MDADRDLAMRLHKEMNELPQRRSAAALRHPAAGTAPESPKPRKAARQKPATAAAIHSDVVLADLDALSKDLDRDLDGEVAVLTGAGSKDSDDDEEPISQALLLDTANREVVSLAWSGTDSDFPCLPTHGGQERLLWEAELVGKYLMLPGSVWKSAAADAETLSWATEHMDDLYLVRVKEYLPRMDAPPGAWLVEHAGEAPFHVHLHDIWPTLEPEVRKKLVHLGGPLPTKWCIAGTAPFGSLFSIYASSIGIHPEKEKHLLWVAQRGYNAPVPAEWEEIAHENGVKSFRRKAAHDNLWCRDALDLNEGSEKFEHPLDDQMRDLVRHARRGDNSSPRARAGSLMEFSVGTWTKPERKTGSRGRGSVGRGSGRGGRGKGGVRMRGRQNVKADWELSNTVR